MPCALLTRTAERTHVLVLAGLMLIMGAASVMVDAGPKPLWSSVGVGVIGVWTGGGLRLRHRQVQRRG